MNIRLALVALAMPNAYLRANDVSDVRAADYPSIQAAGFGQITMNLNNSTSVDLVDIEESAKGAKAS